MILPQLAREWAQKQRSPGDLRTAVMERLLGSDPPPIGYGRVDEFPEDVVVAILQDT